MVPWPLHLCGCTSSPHMYISTTHTEEERICNCWLCISVLQTAKEVQHTEFCSLRRKCIEKKESVCGVCVYIYVYMEFSKINSLKKETVKERGV